MTPRDKSELHRAVLRVLIAEGVRLNVAAEVLVAALMDVFTRPADSADQAARMWAGWCHHLAGQEDAIRDLWAMNAKHGLTVTDGRLKGGRH